MSTRPFIFVMSLRADQPASTSMYSRPDLAAKSTYHFMFSVVKARLPFLSRLPLHQSQAALPGWIHDVSAMAQGGLRLPTTFDSIRLAGCSAIWMTRQGERCGRSPMTAMPGSRTLGERRDSNQCSDQFVPPPARYMAA